MRKPTGYLLFNDGQSVAIATLSTTNRKTGDMVQIWFLDPSMDPVTSVKAGRDAQTICRGCPFASGRGCYVNVGQAPLAIWRAFKRGVYPELHPADYGAVFGGRKVRFGAYGNPSLLPLAMVKAIASVSSGWTGYFHDWRTNPYAAEYSRYFMASTETKDSLKQASSLGFRAFHVSPEKPEGALECLSETHGTSCASCTLCSGLHKRRSPSIWINPHGSKSRKAAEMALGGVL